MALMIHDNGRDPFLGVHQIDALVDVVTVSSQWRHPSILLLRRS
jgi:hypothetical protein